MDSFAFLAGFVQPSFSLRPRRVPCATLPLSPSQHLLCQVVCCRTYAAHHGAVCAQVASSSLCGAWCVSDLPPFKYHATMLALC